MSTQINQYLVYGVLLHYKDFKSEEWYEKLDPYMDSAFEGIHHYNGICVIFDGMNGDYVVIGRVLSKTKDHEYFEGIINVEMLSTTEKEIILGTIRLLIGEELEIEGNYYLIGHYR